MLVTALVIQKPLDAVTHAVGVDAIGSDRLEMAVFMTTSAPGDARAGAGVAAAETSLRLGRC